MNVYIRFLVNTRYVATSLVCLYLLLLSNVAQAGIFTELNQLVTSNIDQVNDESIKMLSHLLGDQFVTTPTQQGFNSSTPNTILGTAFRHFNWFVFLIGMLWMSYVAVASLLQTMHEGKVLGRRFSQAWLPVRIAFGALSLLPVFKGFCFAQVLMMVCTLTGIAGANFITKNVLEASANFSTIVQPALMTKRSLTTAKDIETKLLEATICMKVAAMNSQELAQVYQPSSAAQTQFTFDIQTLSNSAPFYIVQAKFAGPNGPKSCGVLTLKVEPKFDVKMFGQRVTGVNVQAIAHQGIQAHQAAITQLTTLAMYIADGAGDAEHGNAYEKAVDLYAGGYFGTYYKRVQEAYQNQSAAEDNQARSAIDQSLRQNITARGWSTLGAYYGVFAESNDAINRMMEPTFTWDAPDSEGAGHDFNQTIYDQVIATLDSIQSDARHSGHIADQAREDLQLGKHISLGVFNDSSISTTGLLNPINAFRTLGHNIIGLSEVLISMKLNDAQSNSKSKELKQALSKMTVKDISNAHEQNTHALKALFDHLKTLLVSFGWALLVMGMVMAFYLPLIPFVLWFAALIRWVVSVFESMVGASLWALAHFDAEGEGMGRRASYGYTYALSNFAYPMLMVFGFLVASGLITVMGTFLFKMFGTAMATAQGNTLTDLSSILAYLVIFTIMGTTLITSIFNMCLFFQERVLAYIGSQGQTNTAGDFENRTSAMFMSAAAQSSNIAQQQFNPRNNFGQNGPQAQHGLSSSRKLGHR